MSISNFYKKIQILFFRIPVYSNDPNEIDGYVLKDKILESIINNKQILSFQN